MDAKTLKALEGSIKKWEAIVAGTGIDAGSINCPLCGLFYYNECFGCPVLEKTQQRFCKRSPYVEYADLRDEECTADKVLRDAAKKELDFLKSLKPSPKG